MLSRYVSQLAVINSVIIVVKLDLLLKSEILRFNL